MGFLNNRQYVVDNVNNDEIKDFIVFLKGINPDIIVSEGLSEDCLNDKNISCIFLTENKIQNYPALPGDVKYYAYFVIRQAVVVNGIDEMRVIILNNIKRADVKNSLCCSMNKSKDDYDRLKDIVASLVDKDIIFAYNYCKYVENRFYEIYKKYLNELRLLKDSVEKVTNKNGIIDILKLIKNVKNNLEDEMLDCYILEFDVKDKNIDIKKANEEIDNFLYKSEFHESLYKKILSLINNINLLYTNFDYYFMDWAIAYTTYKLYGNGWLEKISSKKLNSKDIVGSSLKENKEKLKMAIEIIDMHSIQSCESIYLNYKCDIKYDYELFDKLIKDGYTINFDLYVNENREYRIHHNYYVGYRINTKEKKVTRCSAMIMACFAGNVGTKQLSPKELLEIYDAAVNKKDFITYTYRIKNNNEKYDLI